MLAASPVVNSSQKDMSPVKLSKEPEVKGVGVMESIELETTNKSKRRSGRISSVKAKVPKTVTQSFPSPKVLEALTVEVSEPVSSVETPEVASSA